MTRSAIVITGADESYFDLLQGTILSIRDKPQGGQVTLAVFDLGLRTEQLDWLSGQVDMVRRADWDFDFSGREAAPEWHKGLCVRPCLRKYFPGFDLYLWLDADAWVQDWSAIDLLFLGAQRRGMAIVPQLDRGHVRQYGGLPQIGGWYHKQYASGFGKAVADQLWSYPMLNAGVVALDAQAPHWDAWAGYLGPALAKRGAPVMDQLALNLAVYGGGLFAKTEMLPAWCNWTCHIGLPAWDQAKNCLVEPYLPHAPIGIVHLTSTPKRDSRQLATTDGGALEVSLRYGSTTDLSFRARTR